MRNKFNIGDIVIIKKDLEIGANYGGVTATPSMIKLAGSTMVVVEVLEFEEGIVYKGLENNYYWTEQMLDSLMFRATPTSDCST